MTGVQTCALPILTFANLTVFKQNATDITFLYSSSSSEDTGAMWYNVSADGYYFATFIVRSSDDENLYTLGTASLDLREEYSIFGTGETLFMAWFFIGTLAFAGIFIGAEMCLLLTIVGVVVFWHLGFIILTATSMMAVVVSGLLVLFKVARK